MSNKYKKRIKPKTGTIQALEYKKERKSLIIAITIVIIILTTIVGFASTKEVLIHHERLDTGVVFVWADGKGNWQNGLIPGGKCSISPEIYIGKSNFKNFKCEVYNGSNFSFSSEETSHWNKTPKCKDKKSYNNNYVDYCATFTKGNVQYDKNSGNLNIKETVKLTSKAVFNVGNYVRWGNQKEIYAYLGDNPPSGITEPMNKMLTDPRVQGYLYFCPMVITYDEVTYIPFGNLLARLDILNSSGTPTKGVKVGESFILKDNSVIEGDELDHTTMYDNNGNEIKEWDGSKLGSELEVKTRRDPDKKGYFQLSYDGGKTWVDGGKCQIE